MGLSWAHPCPDRDWCTPPKSMEINIISKWLTNGLADPKTPSGDPQPAATATPEKAVSRGGWIYGFGGRTHSSWILASCGLRWYKFTVCVCVNASSHYRISLFFFFFNLLYQLLLQANVNSLLWTYAFQHGLQKERDLMVIKHHLSRDYLAYLAYSQHFKHFVWLPQIFQFSSLDSL